MRTHGPDTNLGPTYLAISWTTLSLGAALVAMRAFVRCKMHANGWDDYLIYLAWVSVLLRHHHLPAIARTVTEPITAD